MEWRQGGGEESQGERACEPRPVPPPCECRTVEGLGSPGRWREQRWWLGVLVVEGTVTP